MYEALSAIQSGDVILLPARFEVVSIEQAGLEYDLQLRDEQGVVTRVRLPDEGVVLRAD